MMAFTFPWLLVLLLLIAVLLAYKKHWNLCLGCLILLCVGNYMGEVFAVNLCPFTNRADVKFSKLKILAWNIDGGGSDSTKNCKLFHIIDSLNPDIIFLSENYGQINGLLDNKLADINLKRADCPGDNGHWFYSKIPVKDVKVMTSESDDLAFIVRCKVYFEGLEVSLYGVHLSSNNINRARKYMPIDSISSGLGIFDYLKNIDYVSRLRIKEAEYICNEIKKVQQPVLVIGDMNDVNSSGCIYTLKNAGLEDAWWSAGFGYGATINKPIPYRIDHIMYSQNFYIHNIKVIDNNGLSDHNALYAELSIIDD